jgi:hypothetical protein
MDGFFKVAVWPENPGEKPARSRMESYFLFVPIYFSMMPLDAITFSRLLPSARGLGWSSNKQPNDMRVTDAHRKKLCELMHFAFVEIRQLGLAGKSEQAGDLADAFHNLPKDMWKEDFSLEFLRGAFLAPYQEQYPEGRVRDYVAVVNEMLAKGEDYAKN